MRPATVLATIALAIAIPVTALADQYAWNDRDVAVKGAAVLKQGLRVIHYCEPCKGGHRDKPVTIATKTKVRRAHSTEPYYEVVVDGQAVDLAYVFVERTPGSNTFDNVATVLGLGTYKVSAQLTE